MKRIFLLPVCAVLGLVTSCEALNQGASDKSNIVNFRANVGQYVKATDTALEDGDAVSIAALEPINSGNVKYTVKNGVLTSDTPIRWNRGQEESTTFLLMYPYNASVTDLGGSYKFSVYADQSTHANYTNSDLMAGSVTASPADDCVAFNISHLLSQMVIKIDNRSANAVESVSVEGVRVAAVCSARGIAPSDSLGTVVACPVTSGSAKSWALVLMPQIAKPTVVITTSAGQQIVYAAPEDIQLLPGYRLTANIVVDKAQEVVGFTTTVNDWLSGGEMDFVIVKK